MTTIFQQMIDKKIPAEILYEDDKLMVINDIYPQAPIHWLLISKVPLENLKDATDQDAELLAHLLLTANRLASQGEVGDFRLVMNNGVSAGQTVFHLHMHLLAGKAMDGLC